LNHLLHLQLGALGYAPERHVHHRLVPVSPEPIHVPLLVDVVVLEQMDPCRRILHRRGPHGWPDGKYVQVPVHLRERGRLELIRRVHEDPWPPLIHVLIELLEEPVGRLSFVGVGVDQVGREVSDPKRTTASHRPG